MASGTDAARSAAAARRRARSPPSRARGRSRRCRDGRREPVRASPSPARRASRSSCAASQRRVGGDDRDAAPGGRTWVEPSPIVRERPARRRSGGREPSRSSRARARRPSPRASGTRRLDEPIPPFQPNATMPAPAPTQPCSTAPAVRRRDGPGGVRSLDLHGAGVVEPAVVAFADDGNHDVVDADAPDRPRTRAATAPSKTRPTAIVEVRKTGVSISPHSEIWRNPVSSPAPFRTAAPARARGCGTSDALAPGTIAVTPVRAIPRPVGWRRLVAHTVTWPTRTPATSVIAFARRRAPAGRSGGRARRSVVSLTRHEPIGSPPWRSRSRSSGRTTTGCTSRRPRSGSASGRRRRSVPARAEAIRAALVGAGAEVVAAVRTTTRRSRRCTTPRLLAFLASAWQEWEAAGLPDDPGPGSGRPVHLPAPGPAGRPRAPRAGRDLGAAGGVLLRHDDADRAGHLGGRARRQPTRRSLRPTSSRERRRAAYACCRPAGHHVTRSAYGGSCYLNNAAIAAQRLRELGAARVGHHRHRRPSRQRRPVDLLGARRRVHRLGARRPGDRLVPPLPGRRRGARCGSGAGGEPQRAAAAGGRRRRLAAGGCRDRPGGAEPRRRGARARARRRCGRGRSGEPAAGDARRATARRGGSSPTRGCRASSYRKAATISPRSGSSCSRRWKDWKLDA